jgi:hypothetical protein
LPTTELGLQVSRLPLMKPSSNWHSAAHEALTLIATNLSACSCSAFVFVPSPPLYFFTFHFVLPLA